VATKQHHFIPMYADLCVKLEQHPHIAAAVEVAGNKHDFRRLLLNQCQVVFEQLLEPCNGELALDSEVALVRKQEALGNIKLIGHLLVNGMLGSKMLVECADELISKRTTCPVALESLAALMMVAAPTFDTPEWQYHEKLTSVFSVMRKLTKDKSTVPRSRYLCVMSWMCVKLDGQQVPRTHRSFNRKTKQVSRSHQPSSTLLTLWLPPHQKYARLRAARCHLRLST